MIFQKMVSKAENLKIDLLDRAHATNTEIHKLLLTGGFGDSPYFRAAVRNRLTTYKREYMAEIDFIVAPSQRSGISTATGALLRVLDKEHGHLHVLRMSVGVLRTIPWQPSKYKGSDRWIALQKRK